MEALGIYKMESRSLEFTLTRSSCTLDDGGEIRYTTYGILAVDHRLSETLCYQDISTNKAFVLAFINMCIQHDASFDHITDLLDDYMD